ncbi:hypothetical protein [Microbispora bryophytorum]|uniref:hypothetical protein n=1 Tax=Microbispora bryophytorum TaxID=1460882 RepID=UPI00340C918B
MKKAPLPLFLHRKVPQCHFTPQPTLIANSELASPMWRTSRILLATYFAGLASYRLKLDEVAEAGYKGFDCTPAPR